jgi:hypothetical protein
MIREQINGMDGNGIKEEVRKEIKIQKDAQYHTAYERACQKRH